MKLSTLAAIVAAGTLAWPVAAVSEDKPQRQAAQQSAKRGGMSKEDHQRFQRMAQDNMAEVEAGKLAQQKASSEEVKEFAKHMVEDHGKQLEEMKQMAEKKGASLPRSAGKEHQQAAKKLQAMSGERFDAAYMDQMVKDHRKALKHARDAAKSARDPELKAAAQKAAPDIEKHLKMAQDLSKQPQARSGGKSAAGGASGGKSK